jgi:hypothetical protein
LLHLIERERGSKIDASFGKFVAYSRSIAILYQIFSTKLLVTLKIFRLISNSKEIHPQKRCNFLFSIEILRSQNALEQFSHSLQLQRQKQSQLHFYASGITQNP